MSASIVIASRYELLGRIGSGASADVHRVRDTKSGDELALKVLRPREGGANEALATALHREFATLTTLRHPGLVAVHDFGAWDEEGPLAGAPWFTMDLVVGEPVDRALGAPGDWSRLARVADAVLDALSAVHAAGLVHRDVTVSNVLVGDGRTGDDVGVTLMDLGLVQRVQRVRAGVVRGTPATLAPETLTGGEVDGRADLYSVGCVLYRLVTGQDPFQDEDPWRVLRAHIETPPTAPSHLNPDVPKTLEALILELLAKDPADRPSSAAAARAELAPLSGHTPSAPPPLSRALRPSFSGRERELARFGEALRALESGEGAVLLVQGASGSGKTRVLEEMRLLARLSGRPAFLVPCREAPRAAFGAIDLATRLAGGSDSSSPRVSSHGPARRSDALAVRMSAEGSVLLFDDADDADAASADVLLNLARRLSGERDRGLLVLSIGETPGPRGESALVDALLETGRARVVRLRALSASAVERIASSMLGLGAAPNELVQALVDEADGLPGRVEQIVRAVVATSRLGDAFDDPGRALHEVARQDAREGFLATWSELSPASRRLAAALAVAGRPITVRDASTLVGELAEDASVLDPLVERGLAVRVELPPADVGLALNARVPAETAVELMDEAEIAGLCRARAQQLEGRGGAHEERADLLRRAGEAEKAASLYLRAAETSLAEGVARDAIRIADAGLSVLPADARDGARVGLRAIKATALARTGRATDAATEFEGALDEARSVGDPLGLASVLREAGRFAGDRGDAARALGLLEEALAILDELADTGGGAEVLLEISRLLVRTGDAEGAARRLDVALRQARRAGRSGLEARVLLSIGEVALRRGRGDEADASFRDAEAAAERSGNDVVRDAARRGRVLSHLDAHRFDEAHDQARAWLDAAHHVENLEGEAEAGFLLGRSLAALGRRSEALRVLEEALLAARRVERPGLVAETLSEIGRQLLHKARLRSALGRVREAHKLASEARDAQAARAAARAAAEIAALRGLPGEVEDLLPKEELGELDLTVRSLRLGEAHLRAQHPDRARELLQEACFMARRCGRDQLEHEGLLGLAEAYLDLREDDRAMLALKRVRGAAEADLGGDEILARARLLAAERELSLPDGEMSLALQEAELAAEALGTRERDDLAWRAHAARAGAARRLGRADTVHEASERAFRALDALLAGLPDGDAARFKERPRVRTTLSTCAPEPGAAASAEPPQAAGPGDSDAPALAALQRHAAQLERLLEINRTLNSVLDLRTVLQTLLDTAIDLTGAERGFVLLEKDGRPEVELARGAGGEDLSGVEARISRDVARRVTKEGRPLLSHDAAQDERLSASESVHALQIRSLLAHPLRVRGEVAGALVLDTRTTSVMFTRREERLVGQLADQAGIALGNARFVEELRRQAEEIRSLNERLSAEVEEQRVELLEKQSNLEVRYRYDCIIGASRPMQKLYRSLEKIIPTDIPVLITGESGTGKDLVARVLHYNGERRDQRFVTVNCAALTDTLLESELFGHRRGAFTGADRDRRGLFEQADGGTLFLDEIGEMPIHLQPKLLRAIQFGEIRRVGEDSPRRVSTRIVAATNRDLMQQVSEASFREDLFYRLDVGRIHLAPLRERMEDIGLLVDHFLGELAEGDDEVRKTIEPAALRLFLRHEWPGNVRELYNEVTKLGTFTEGEVITEIDVLENATFLERTKHARRATAAAEPPEEPRDGVRTLESNELEQIRKALRASGGNRSKAAAMLGIDRSTLYRKLKRYGEG